MTIRRRSAKKSGSALRQLRERRQRLIQQAQLDDSDFPGEEDDHEEKETEERVVLERRQVRLLSEDEQRMDVVASPELQLLTT